MSFAYGSFMSPAIRLEMMEVVAVREWAWKEEVT